MQPVSEMVPATTETTSTVDLISGMAMSSSQ